MGILSGSGSGNFDRQLESATSQLQLEPNWASILEICDCIRQKDVTPKYAVTQIKKKIFDRNPHVSKFALVVIEACMKNCGSPLHDEVATKEFMDELRTLVKTAGVPVKEQTLSIIQAWNKALGKKPNYKIVHDTYNLLTMEGYTFPSMNESDAMFSADTAPEWDEGEVCHLCRVKFSTFTRQHHCRCCGQVFCSKCSAKTSIIPKYGIEREVRVCDSCFQELNPSSGKEKEEKGKSGNCKSEEEIGDLPAEYLASALSKEAQVKPQSSAEDIKAQEEEEFQLAMALSLSAAESDPKAKHTSISGTTSSSPYSSHSISSYSEPKKSGLYADVVADSRKAPDTNDPELSRYLNREYWERRKEERSLEPSAPVALHEPEETQINSRAPQNNYVEPQDEEEENSDSFVQTMDNSLDMFINRMQTVTGRGKHIAMDTTVQSLFQSLSAMHPQLMKLIEDEDDSKAKYEAMLQKLSLLREARESLDDMRNQHRQKLRQQELEQEMLRRMQMEQKLELMRQQKQEYLEYQRQLQIQRQQELEAQQQFKFEQRQMTRIQPQAYQYQQGEGGTYPELQQQYPDQYPSQVTSSGYTPEQGPPSYAAAVGNQLQMQQQGQIHGGNSHQQPSPNNPRPSQDPSPPGGPSGSYGQIAQNQHPVPQQIARPQPLPQQLPGLQQLPQQIPGSQPLPQQIPGSQPLPQQTPGSQPLSQQIPGSQPLPQHIPGSQQLPQQAYQQPQQSHHPQQLQQQQQQKPTSDLLDAPIGSEVYAQPPSYQDNASQQLQYNQQNPPQQQYPPHQQPQSQPSYQQQQPSVQQQQPPAPQQQYTTSQQYPQQTQPPQQSSMSSQQQYQQHQQPAAVNGPPSIQPQYTASSDPIHQTNLQGQAYPSQAYPSQQQNQLNQQGEIASQYQQMQQQHQQQQQQQQPPQQQQQTIPSQYTHLQSPQLPQGPSSLQYIPPHAQVSQHHGPSSLPPNINQYSGGGQSYGSEPVQNYAPRPMPGGQPPQQYTDPPQNYASQAQPPDSNQQELTGHMKDLQLISFE